MASTVPDRGTKINMDLMLTIEDIQQIHTPKRLLPILEVTPSSKKRKASPLETYSAARHSEGRALTSAIIAKPALYNQALVPTDKAAVGTPDTLWESPWDHYQQVFELSLGSFVVIVSERAPPHDLFTMRKF